MTTRLMYYSHSPSNMNGASSAERDTAARHPAVDVLTFLAFWGAWQPAKGGPIDQGFLDRIRRAVDDYGKPIAVGLSGGFNVKSSTAWTNVPRWVFDEPNIEIVEGYAIPGSPGTTAGRTIWGPVPWIGPYQKLMADAQEGFRDQVLAIPGVHVVEATVTWSTNESSSELRLPNGNGTKQAADGTYETNWYQLWLDHGFSRQLGADLFASSLDHMATLWPPEVDFDFHFITAWPPGCSPIADDQEYAWSATPGRLITCFNQQPKITAELQRALDAGEPIGGQLVANYWGDGLDKTVAGYVCNEQSFAAETKQCESPPRRYIEVWAKTVCRTDWAQHLPITPTAPTYDELVAENARLEAEVARLTALNTAQNDEIANLENLLSGAEEGEAAALAEVGRLTGLIDNAVTSAAALAAG